MLPIMQTGDFERDQFVVRKWCRMQSSTALVKAHSQEEVIGALEARPAMHGVGAKQGGAARDCSHRRPERGTAYLRIGTPLASMRSR